ncbi:hypothetical protein ACFS07_15645 [Undibacterium arcticum]
MLAIAYLIAAGFIALIGISGGALWLVVVAVFGAGFFVSAVPKLGQMHWPPRFIQPAIAPPVSAGLQPSGAAGRLSAR